MAIDPTLPKFIWDVALGRYRYVKSGRLVSWKTIREQMLEKSARAGRKRVRQWTQQLRDGVMSLSQWRRNMADEVKYQNLNAAAAAKGGWSQMTQSDYGRAGAAIRRQYEYLDKATMALKRGAPLDGRFFARAEMYPESSRTLFQKIRETKAVEEGMLMEQNKLGIADHCSGCITAERMGIVPIGSLTPIGFRDCLTRCHCWIVYVDPETEREME